MTGKQIMGVLVGIALIGGCMSTTDVEQPKQVKQSCEYSKTAVPVVSTRIGANPGLAVGNVFSLQTSSIKGSLDTEGVFTAMVEDGTYKTLYQIDVKTFDSNGWDRVTSVYNYYVVDSVEEIRVTGLEALQGGVPNIDDVNKVYTLCTIKAHAIHHHTEGSK